MIISIDPEKAFRKIQKYPSLQNVVLFETTGKVQRLRPNSNNLNKLK